MAKLIKMIENSKGAEVFFVKKKGSDSIHYRLIQKIDGETGEMALEYDGTEVNLPLALECRTYIQPLA